MRRDGRKNLHMLKCVTYSASVIAPFPISSISRSFQAPGCAFEVMKEALFMIFVTEQWKPGSPQFHASGPSLRAISLVR